MAKSMPSPDIKSRPGGGGKGAGVIQGGPGGSGGSLGENAGIKIIR